MSPDFPFVKEGETYLADSYRVGREIGLFDEKFFEGLGKRIKGIFQKVGRLTVCSKEPNEETTIQRYVSSKNHANST